MQSKSIFILLTALAMIFLLNADAWCITMTDVSKVTIAINNLKTLQSQAPATQKSQYQNCINNLVTYQNLLQKAFVGTGPNPGPMPVCTVSSVAPAASVPVTITAPATVPVPAGKTGTFNVSFGGTGVAGATLQATTGLSASMKITGQSSGTSAAAISVTPANGCTGGTITLLLTNSNKGILKSQPIRVTVTPAATSAATSASTAAVGNLNITPPPGTVSLPAGKNGTFPISFSGTGIDRVAVQASGTGFTASVANTSFKPYPNTCTATVSITASSNFQGGTVTFQLINNSRGVILQKAIAVPVVIPPTASRASVAAKNGWPLNSNVNPADPALPATASDKVAIVAGSPSVVAGKPTAFQVAFGPGTGEYHTQIQVSPGADFNAALGTSWGTSPSHSTSTITITPNPGAGGKAGETITFLVHNSAGTVIGSKVIPVTITNPNPVPTNTTASTSTSSDTNADAECAIKIAKSYLGSPAYGEQCLHFVTIITYNKCNPNPICNNGCEIANDLYNQKKVNGDIHDPKTSAPRGALVFFKTSSGMGHVGISLGKEEGYKYISALPAADGGVAIKNLNYVGTYLGWSYPYSKYK